MIQLLTKIGRFNLVIITLFTTINHLFAAMRRPVSQPADPALDQ